MALLQKAIVLVQARKFDDALAAYREAQTVEPNKDVPRFALGYALAGKGSYNEAAEHYRKSVEQLGGEEKYSQPLVYLAVAYAWMPDKRHEAWTILRRIEAMPEYTSPALLAAVYAALDDNDKAMDLLERAYNERDLLLRFVGVGYEYDGLRKDPRFQQLLTKIGLQR
jgi:tetratricopeptide (TPR) repeat protein